MNEPYTYENPVSEMTENELLLMRNHGKHPADRVAAAAEIRRREQAGPSPGRWQIGYNEALVVAVGPEPCIVADCATDCAVSPERAKANAAFIVRAKKLAADNERLRALVIATATGIREVADLLAPTAPATAASLRHRADAAIEAAKEATHAK